MSTPHLDPLAWARLLGGGLGPVARWRVVRHLAACDTCRARRATLVRERQAFEASPARAAQLAVLLERARRGPAPAAGSWRLAVAAGGLGLVLAVAAVLARPGEDPEFDAKGLDAFTVFAVQPQGAAPLGPTCKPGDRLAVSYRTERRAVLVLEHDGAGAIQTLHKRAGSVPLGSGERPTSSWVLDDEPGEECFAAFFSDAEVDLEAASAAMRANPHAPGMPRASVQVRCCLKGARR